MDNGRDKVDIENRVDIDEVESNCDSQEPESPELRHRAWGLDIGRNWQS